MCGVCVCVCVCVCVYGMCMWECLCKCVMEKYQLLALTISLAGRLFCC